MKIVTTDGKHIRIKPHTSPDFEKIGTPGQRRWHVRFIRVGSKIVEKLPVRNVSRIATGV
jgi:predicted secreted protein